MGRSAASVNVTGLIGILEDFAVATTVPVFGEVSVRRSVGATGVATTLGWTGVVIDARGGITVVLIKGNGLPTSSVRTIGAGRRADDGIGVDAIGLGGADGVTV